MATKKHFDGHAHGLPFWSPPFFFLRGQVGAALVLILQLEGVSLVSAQPHSQELVQNDMGRSQRVACHLQSSLGKCNSADGEGAGIGRKSNPSRSFLRQSPSPGSSIFLGNCFFSTHHLLPNPGNSDANWESSSDTGRAGVDIQPRFSCIKTPMDRVLPNLFIENQISSSKQA